MAMADNHRTAVNTPTTFDVRANDIDVDDATSTLVVSVTSATSAGGTISCDAAGMCTYTPPGNFVGSDSLTYRVTDPQGLSSQATVTITVVI